MTTQPGPGWTVIVPVKLIQLAKSRLRGFTPAARQRLAWAFALDTVLAAASSQAVDRVVVVTNDPDAARFEEVGAEVIGDQPDAGLNPALSHAVRVVRRDAAVSVAALSADLPCLRHEDLTRVLALAPAPRWFVPDWQGSGTTLLAAAGAARWQPAFGESSRLRHLELGMVEVGLEGMERLRCDVDTLADLRAARLLGVGAHTSQVLVEHTFNDVPTEWLA